MMKGLNLIFIMFDDLRPELSIYGRDYMITPNFERLASKSVIFDKAFAQISVCNPSRDSLLTGLRPDSGGTYNFQSSYKPHMTIPMQLARTNYTTIAFGKIFHWELKDDRDVWNQGVYENDWYGYQNIERGFMNSSTLPDKVQKEENFRDYDYTTKAIESLNKFAKNKSQKFMLALGYKLPHLQVHMPYKYYEMYNDKKKYWKLNRRESRFPRYSPDVAYRCCAEPKFMYMNQEGSVPSERIIEMGDINMVYTETMRDELMQGYVASITFVDKQLGRLLDAIDENDLWKNSVIVLTSDHGMHNGEKGIWEKWSLFDESSSVPLLIAHPDSPFKGQHYKYPVELIDIYPTIIDLLLPPFQRNKVCWGTTHLGRDPFPIRCHELQGQTLAPVVVGLPYYKKYIHSNINHKSNFDRQITEPVKLFSLIKADDLKLLPLSKWTTTIDNSTLVYKPMEPQYHTMANSGHNPLYSPLQPLVTNDMPIMHKQFALTQSWRCAKLEFVKNAAKWYKLGSKGARPPSKWIDCDKTKPDEDDTVSVIGYSMRTLEFRYTAWLHYNKRLCIPLTDLEPFEEELYDHRNETFKDFTHLEITNIVNKPVMSDIVFKLRNNLLDFIRNEMLFRGCFRD